MEEFFATLADRTRLRILNLLAMGEICVCWFTHILGAPQPTVSRHLAHLREAGLVTARRDGKWMHYSLAKESPQAPLLRAVLEQLKSDPEMQKDAEALNRACCALRPVRRFLGMPKPTLTRR